MKNTVVLGLLLTLIRPSPARAEERIDFNLDVRPILANHCWQCHGFDQHSRQAGLRLDIREHAAKPGESGEVAIVPGDPDRSELISRVTADDENMRMPPVSTNKPLSAAQIETLRKWISEGAEYQRHWAFEPLRKPDIPSIGETHHPIDAFVAARLTRHGLRFTPEAQREILLRRVSFDLTGLPPTLEELDRVDESYENAVDRLLNSPHFGERMAVDWLDAARYADTNGYFSDKPRQMWLWRDWVIDAFNKNKPFDQFTIEQLAGDLLPNPTIPQRIATGFNRNHVANNETGIIDEEFRTEYVVDRVDTTMTTWMGLTAACAQCHDHKYDPVSQREFYQLFSFFNNVPETGLIVTDNPPPLMTVTTPEQERQLAELTAAAAAATEFFAPLRAQMMSEIADWESEAISTLPSPPEKSMVLYESFNGQLETTTRTVGTRLTFPSGVRGQAAKFDATQHAERDLRNFNADLPWSIGFWISPEGSLGCPLSKIVPEGNRQGFEFLWQKGRLGINLVESWNVRAIEVLTQEPVKSGQWHHVAICYDGSRKAAGLTVLIDGTTMPCDVRRDSLAGSIVNDEPLRIGRRDSGLGYYGLLDELRIFQQSLSQQKVIDWFHSDQIRGILEIAPDARGSRSTETLLDYYIDHYSEASVREARSEMKRTQKVEKNFRDSIPTTLVMQEMPQPRTTHVLNRGQYDLPGEIVSPGVPAALSEWPAEAPLNRLGLSQWLVSGNNPLTARVAVNRLWKQCFGEGLVRTMNDFGTQGEPPTHPELLDWLAITFQESGWDVKAMLRLIVTSRTYRQDSAFHTDGATIVDLHNRMLARGPSFRMPAEMIRDQALTASGLLRTQVGGPSVKPYQPPGLWEEVSYDAEDTYVADTGDGLWRRSLYTYLKRQAPPPSFLSFDGITREKCNVQRARTNTPLQSLILLNDSTYVEAARVLASSVLQAKSDDRDRLIMMFRRVLSRYPEDAEVRTLEELLQRQRQRFSISPDAAKSLIAVGESKSDEHEDSSELAAWTVVAHTLLNLDEAITRR